MKPTETLKELTIGFVFIFLASFACYWAIAIVDERKQKQTYHILTESEYEIYLKAKTLYEK